MAIKIFCEDWYGKAFFKKVVQRLKDEGKIPPSNNIDVGRFYGPCNPKIERQIKASLTERDYKLFIIVADGDANPTEVKQKIMIHIPEGYGVYPLIFDYEIEEWICITMGLGISDKPSKVLKHRNGYKKNDLPDYADRLDIDNLMRCSSFSEFVSILG